MLTRFRVSISISGPFFQDSCTAPPGFLIENKRLLGWLHPVIRKCCSCSRLRPPVSLRPPYAGAASARIPATMGVPGTVLP